MNIPTAFRRGVAILIFLLPLLLHAQPASWTPVGVGGGGALFLPSFSPHNANELYVACDMSELFHSTDLGASWGQVDYHQLQVSGGVGRMQFTNDPSVLFTISRPNDVPHPVKSTDGGATWHDLQSDPTEGEAYSLWVDPANPARIIISSYADIYFSTDGGATFSKKFSNPGGAGCHIGGVYFDGTKIFIGTNVGLVRSSDNGATFTVAGTPGIPSDQGIVSLAGARQGQTFRLLAVTLGTADLYAGITGADHAGFKGVYTLEGGGGGWTDRTPAFPSGAHPFFAGMALNNTEVMYVAGGSDDGVPTIFKSTDHGGTWASALTTDNNGNVRTGWQGTNGDRGWSYGEYALGFAVSPTDPNRAAITDLGFVHVTSNGGGEWRQAYVSTADENPAGAPTPKGKAYHGIGIENTTCWQVAWADSAHMIAAFSDIKGIVSSDGGAAWSFDYTGHDLNSMYRIAIQPSTGALYAATASVHDIYQSTTLTDARIDGGSGRVLLSTDKGHTWSTLHDFGHPVVWVAIDPKDEHTLYASVAHSAQGGIYVSKNIQNGSASTWTKLAAPPRTEGHPFNIQVLNDGAIVCTFSGRRTSSFTASSGVFMSTDGGATWSDRSSQQMQYWTKDVVIDPHDPSQSTWYVGVFSGWGGAPNGLGGLYRTTDRGGSWKKILDADRVTSCTVSPTNPNEMYATTEVEGLWYSGNARSADPTFTNVASYPFRQPERVFYNPYRPGDIWVTSFGNGMKHGTVTTSSTPVAPALHLPANGTTGEPTLTTLHWRPVPGATSYHLQLTMRADFSTIQVDVPNITDTSYTPPKLASGIIYYWRVSASNASGEGAWSEAWQFETGAASGVEGREALPKEMRLSAK